MLFLSSWGSLSSRRLLPPLSRSLFTAPSKQVEYALCETPFDKNGVYFFMVPKFHRTGTFRLVFHVMPTSKATEGGAGKFTPASRKASKVKPLEFTVKVCIGMKRRGRGNRCEGKVLGVPLRTTERRSVPRASLILIFFSVPYLLRQCHEIIALSFELIWRERPLVELAPGGYLSYVWWLTPPGI